MTKDSTIRYFECDDNRFAYHKFGDGPIALLAFHGFGQDGRVFSVFAELADNRYTVYAPDLFYHGNSYYAADQLPTKKKWQGLLQAFLVQQRINQFDLLGYSLGGRFALVTLEAFSDQVGQLILLSPDGITRSIWYRLATGSGLGRVLFHSGLRHLSAVHWLGHAFTRLGLLNRTAMRFAEMALATPSRRQMVYQSWTQFRLIQPDLGTISTLLNQKISRVRFFTGTYDRIVPGLFIMPLTRRLRHYELIVLRAGHTHLIDLAASQLTQSAPNHLPQTNN